MTRQGLLDCSNRESVASFDQARNQAGSLFRHEHTEKTLKGVCSNKLAVLALFCCDIAVS